MLLKRINIILLLFIIIFSGINSLSIVRATEEIDAKFLNFLLSEQNVTQYHLRTQCQMKWLIGPDMLGDCVDQEWISYNETTKIGVMIGFFDSEEAAIRGMHYYTHTTAEPWLWGTLFNGIFGRHSWRSFNNDKALIFAHGNIGVLISRYHGDDQTAIPLLANAQMEKIKQNLGPKILLYREILRESQLSSAEYDNYLAEKVEIDLTGFTQISNEDSLWLKKDECLVMGIRREWQNDQGRVMGIDICKLESNNLASEVADERLKMTHSDIEAIPGEISQSSNVLVYDQVVIHLYSFDYQQTSKDTTKKPSHSFSYLSSSFYDPLNQWPFNLWAANLWLDRHSPPYPAYFSEPIFNTLFDNYFSNNNYQNISDYLSPSAGICCLNIFLNQNMGYEKASFKNYTNYYPIDPFSYSGKDRLFGTASFVNHYFDFSDFNNIYNNLYHFEPSWDYPEWLNNNHQPFFSLASLQTYPYMDFMFSQ